jgi:hypothetical protein
MTRPNRKHPAVICRVTKGRPAPRLPTPTIEILSILLSMFYSIRFDVYTTPIIPILHLVCFNF